MCPGQWKPPTVVAATIWGEGTRGLVGYHLTASPLFVDFQLLHQLRTLGLLEGKHGEAARESGEIKGLFRAHHSG